MDRSFLLRASDTSERSNFLPSIRTSNSRERKVNDGDSPRLRRTVSVLPVLLPDHGRDSSDLLPAATVGSRGNGAVVGSCPRRSARASSDKVERGPRSCTPAEQPHRGDDRRSAVFSARATRPSTEGSGLRRVFSRISELPRLNPHGVGRYPKKESLLLSWVSLLSLLPMELN